MRKSNEGGRKKKREKDFIGLIVQKAQISTQSVVIGAFKKYWRNVRNQSKHLAVQLLEVRLLHQLFSHCVCLPFAAGQRRFTGFLGLFDENRRWKTLRLNQTEEKCAAKPKERRWKRPNKRHRSAELVKIIWEFVTTISSSFPITEGHMIHSWWRWKGEKKKGVQIQIHREKNKKEWN